MGRQPATAVHGRVPIEQIGVHRRAGPLEPIPRGDEAGRLAHPGTGRRGLGGAAAGIGYRLPIGSRFVGTPRAGMRTSEYGRDFRVGYGMNILIE